jgi:hypothetical protein
VLRNVLAVEEAELLPWRIDDESTFTRYEAAAYRTEVKKRLQAPRANRVFNQRALMGLKENRMARASCSSSTSKRSAAFGGIADGAPFSP